MKRKTNLFYLEGQDSKFITFGNYTESLTGNFLSTDTKLYPSRFLCLKISETGDDAPAGLSDEAKKHLIKYLTAYYESKMTILRDKILTTNSNIEHKILPLNYLLEALFKIKELNKDGIVISDVPILSYILVKDLADLSDAFFSDYANEKIYCAYNNVVSIEYISNITEQDYNGTFTDTICNVDLNNFNNVKYITIDNVYRTDDNVIQFDVPVSYVTNNISLWGWEYGINSQYTDVNTLPDMVDGISFSYIIGENYSYDYLSDKYWDSSDSDSSDSDSDWESSDNDEIEPNTNSDEEQQELTYYMLYVTHYPDSTDMDYISNHTMPRDDDSLPGGVVEILNADTNEEIDDIGQILEGTTLKIIFRPNRTTSATHHIEIDTVEINRRSITNFVSEDNYLYFIITASGQINLYVSWVYVENNSGRLQNEPNNGFVVSNDPINADVSNSVWTDKGGIPEPIDPNLDPLNPYTEIDSSDSSDSDFEIIEIDSSESSDEDNNDEPKYNEDEIVIPNSNFNYYNKLNKHIPTLTSLSYIYNSAKSSDWSDFIEKNKTSDTTYFLLFKTPVYNEENGETVYEYYSYSMDIITKLDMNKFEYYTDSSMTRLNVGHEDKTSLKFNAIIPLYDVVNTNFRGNFNDVRNVDDVDLIDTQDNNLYCLNVPLGMWFFTEDNGNKLIELYKDVESGFTQTWSLTISSQFKSFPYSQSMPSGMGTNYTTNSFATFAQVLSSQSELVNTFNKMTRSFEEVNQRLNAVETQLANMSTIQNIDGLQKKMINYQNEMNNQFANLRDNVLSYIDGLRWKTTI